MREQAEIERKLKGLLCEELDRRLYQSTRRLPTKCTHNHRQPLDHRKTVNGEPNPNYNRISSSAGDRRHLDVVPVEKTLGLCMLNAKGLDDWQGAICEDPIDAQRCPYFTPKQSPGEVYDQYVKDLQTLKLTGEMQALLWVLGDSESMYLPGENPHLSIPWWKKFWFKYILKVNYEPLDTKSIREVTVDLLPTREDVIEQSRNQNKPS